MGKFYSDMKISLDGIIFIKKSQIAFYMFCAAIMLAYWGSLMPWFLWPILKYNNFIVALLLGLSFYISFYLSSENIFNREQYGLPTLLALIVITFMRLLHGAQVIGVAEGILITFVFFSLFKLNCDYLQRLMRIICITMAAFLLVSMIAFLLFLLGFPLPSRAAMTEDGMYNFDNYYLFLTGENSFFFIPRFHSVFLEPGHLGTATSFLLFSQVGKWKKWYCIVLLFATLITFSLAAYVLLVLIMFASAWIQHKQFFLKLLAIVMLIAAAGIGSFFYNQGDNMLYTMIVERLEVDDGKLVGDNRVTGSFEAAYDDFIESDDIWFGRGYKMEDWGFGNAGYRVFIYDNGLICLFLVMVFFLSAMLYCHNRRAALCVLLIGSAAFWVRATPFHYYFFLPLYALPYRTDINQKPKVQAQSYDSDIHLS